jgi:hypothetical protein
MATSKYVLTSAQAKTVGGRPPWPNSASDDGAADSDIGLETVGENLGEGGELATVDENEEGEVSREMLIAMAELTFDWLKPPEKKKKKKRGRGRKRGSSKGSKSPLRSSRTPVRGRSASASPSRSRPGADRHAKLMNKNLAASKKRTGRSASASRSPSRSRISMSRSPSRSSSKDGKKGKKKRKKKKKKKEPVNPFEEKWNAWYESNSPFLEEGTLLNALSLVLRVFEQTFKIDPNALADLLNRKVFEKDQIIADLQAALEEEARKVFETKRMALDYRTEMKKAVKRLKDFELLKSNAVRNMEIAERDKRAALKEAKRLSDINEDLKDELKAMTKSRDKALTKIERREKAISILNGKLTKAIGEKAIVEQRKGRESDMLRRTEHRCGQLEAKVLEMEEERRLKKIEFEEEIEAMVKSSNASTLQYKRQVDKANGTIADYRIQVHEWQVKELSQMPTTIDKAVKRIANHAAQFMDKINEEAKHDPKRETSDEYRRRWKAIRFQVEEMRTMAWNMLDSAKLKALVRTKKEHDLETVVSEWKLKAQAASAELAKERVLTKMLRRVFQNVGGRMRGILHVSGTKKKEVFSVLEKNRKWDIQTGSMFTLTCCKWCGHFFVEEDGIWPCPCEVAGQDHEVLEEMEDPTTL